MSACDKKINRYVKNVCYDFIMSSNGYDHEYQVYAKLLYMQHCSKDATLIYRVKQELYNIAFYHETSERSEP